MTQLALTLLASSTESKKSGPIGLAVILILCVACYFLFKSMSKHMRKVREGFPGIERPAETPDAADSPAAAETPAAPEQAQPSTQSAEPPPSAAESTN